MDDLGTTIHKIASGKIIGVIDLSADGVNTDIAL